MHAQLADDAPIDYLEFGVFQGESMRHWVTLNQHPDSRFYGFDSFEGLPEDWKRFDGQMVKAHFDVKGSVPDIDDPRVSFVRGWFQETVDEFLAVVRHPLAAGRCTSTQTSTRLRCSCSPASMRCWCRGRS